MCWTAEMEAADLVRRIAASPRASMATAVNGLGFFAVTPQTPYDPALSTVEQARQMFAKADDRLAAIGSQRGAMAFCAILLRDIAEVAAFNAEWDAWVAGIAPPARACFQASLASPDMRVEMIVVCATAPDDN